MKYIDDIDLLTIKNGYFEYEQEYRCIFCEKSYSKDEVFPSDGHYYLAEAAIKKHIQTAHQSVLEQLLQLDKKENSLTDVQRQLMRYFAQGKSDKEIVNLTGNSSSTIRHQRYQFKEKARQAKIYLALYELVAEKSLQEDFMELGVEMNTDYLLVNRKEEEKVLKNMVISMQPFRLKQIPTKAKAKTVVLKYIADEFESGKEYSEKEVNAILKTIYEPDYVSLRRHLIEYKFLKRTLDGSKYYKTI